MNTLRQPKGQPSGGQFANRSRSESVVSLPKPQPVVGWSPDPSLVEVFELPQADNYAVGLRDGGVLVLDGREDAVQAFIDADVVKIEREGSEIVVTSTTSHPDWRTIAPAAPGTEDFEESGVDFSWLDMNQETIEEFFADEYGANFQGTGDWDTERLDVRVYVTEVAELDHKGVAWVTTANALMAAESKSQFNGFIEAVGSGVVAEQLRERIEREGASAVSRGATSVPPQ